MMGRITISIPKELIEKLDEKRGDIPRSRYVTGLIKKALEVA